LIKNHELQGERNLGLPSCAAENKNPAEINSCIPDAYEDVRCAGTAWKNPNRIFSFCVRYLSSLRGQSAQEDWLIIQ